MKPQDEYVPEYHRTSDLYYAAFLLAAGVPYVDTQREGRRVFFLFEQNEFVKDLQRGYYNDTAKIPPRSYANAIKDMKSLTHTKMSNS